MDIQSLPGLRVDCQLFAGALPSRTTAIYFLRSDKHGLLYIGRASDLCKRWTGGISHHCLENCLKLGDVTLHWMIVSRDMLAATEKSLILEHRPPWNQETKRPKGPWTQLEIDCGQAGADIFRKVRMW
jgi:excinuclease UvrABC nuclease subunit